MHTRTPCYRFAFSEGSDRSDRFTGSAPHMRLAVLALALLLGGCLTDDTSDGGDNGGGADTLESVTTFLGAHETGNYGSALDLDSMRVFTYADAPENASDIDLFYAYSETEQGEAFYSPMVAKTGIGGSSGFGEGRGGPADWAVANETPMRRVTVAEPEAIDTRAALDSLWETGVAVEDGRLLAAQDMDFMARSDKGMLSLIRVLELVPGPTGFAGIRVRAVFAGTE